MCFSRVCCCCVCIVLLVVAIGFVFGFGVYQHGFEKIKNAMHDCEGDGVNGTSFCGRRFLDSPPRN